MMPESMAKVAKPPAKDAVEIHRARVADVEREVANFGRLAQHVGQLPRHRIDALQGRPLRSIYEDLELVLVVEGEHLERHGSQRAQHQREPEE